MCKHTHDLFKNILKPRGGLFSALLWGAVFLLASTGFAQAQSTLGALMCNMHDNFKSFGNVFQYVAYGAGAFAVIQGIHHLKLHSINPSGAPLNKGLMLFFGAACLMALPGFVGMIIHTLWSTPGAGGTLVCTADNGGASGGGLEVMLTNFVNNLRGPIISICSLTGILSGLYMVVRGLMKASKYGFDPKTHSIHSILTYVGFGALLITIGDNLNSMLGTVFGSGITSNSAFNAPISWTAIENLVGGDGLSDKFQLAVEACLHFFQLIGAIAFVRGWLIMKKVVEGAGGVTLAQGIAHIFGGVLAVNIFNFLKIMDATFGTNLL